MLKACKYSNAEVYESLRNGEVDNIDISFPGFVDDIILEMMRLGILDNFKDTFDDKRRDNSSIPLNVFIILAAAAKMKLMTSLTDIPFAINDPEVLAELGWNLDLSDKNSDKGTISNGAIRGLLDHYTTEEIICMYNNFVQLSLESLEYVPTIHILDCTKIFVNPDNENYENSSVRKIEGELKRGYKLASLRGVLPCSGVIEEIEIGTLKEHDLSLSMDILLNSPTLKPGDIVIEDRGFLSREVMNRLKIERQVDTYIPVKKNMIIYKEAVNKANEQNNWEKHPNESRENQMITYVPKVGCYWQSDNPEEDVELNASVVYDKKEDKYYVFVTTAEVVTGKKIVETYELRPEIEEDFRQLKDFWQLDDFTTTKFNHITFHIVMTLLGYFFFQLYKNTEAGQEFANKSLPVILKKYVPKKKTKKIIVFAGDYFGLFSLREFCDLYASCKKDIRKKIGKALE